MQTRQPSLPAYLQSAVISEHFLAENLIESNWLESVPTLNKANSLRDEYLKFL